MLKNIDPVLTPDALYALCAMGHGDEVVICDSHYPAENAARQSGYGKLIRLDAGDSARAIRAVLSVVELDSFVEHPAERMLVDEQPAFLPNVQSEAQAAVYETAGKQYVFGGIARQDFYGRAKKAFAVIITGETRGWGCFILRKGLIVTPDEPNSNKNTTVENYQTK